MMCSLASVLDDWFMVRSSSGSQWYHTTRMPCFGWGIGYFFDPTRRFQEVEESTTSWSLCFGFLRKWLFLIQSGDWRRSSMSRIQNWDISQHLGSRVKFLTKILYGAEYEAPMTTANNVLSPWFKLLVKPLKIKITINDDVVKYLSYSGRNATYSSDSHRHLNH